MSFVFRGSARMRHLRLLTARATYVFYAIQNIKKKKYARKNV